MVDLIDRGGGDGCDYVGLSSDSFVNGYPHNGVIETVPTGQTTPLTLRSNVRSQWTLGSDLNTPDRWKKVIRKLASLREGKGYKYSISDLEKIAGGNFIRVLRETLPGYTQPRMVSVVRNQGNVGVRYRFDWEDVRVNTCANVPVPNPQYRLWIYGETNAGWQKVFESDPLPESILDVGASEIGAQDYEEYRGYLRAENPEKASAEYVNSPWFYFKKTPQS